MYRTNNCGELRLKDINKNVILSGWINKIRKMKLYTFIDIRDYYGITQLIIYKKINIKIKNEYLIKIKGKVIKRKKYNNKIKTGKIEILVKKIKILNKSKKLPFYIGEKKINNNLFKYRYLYLRHSKIKENLIFKFKIINLIRKFFIKKGFIELETPFLVKSSSEGARDFIIPYRKKKGLFYSLPQSPQIFKQLFMIGGFDKYYQIVKCFRDEDYRLDRQPEFTQLDLEMSFIKKEDIFKLIEFLIKYLLYKIFKLKKINFIKLSYKKVIKYYKTDKPDLRFKLFKIKIKKKYLKNNKKKKIDTFIIPNYYNIKNKKKINKILKKNKNILIYNKKKIKKKYFFSKYDYLLILINKKKKKIKKIVKIINKILFKSKYKKNIYIPLWIYNFPLFKKKKGIFNSYHHPFTKPINKKKINYKSLANSYDLIINGIEIGSGSIRINNYKLQKKVLKLLKLSKKEINKDFGFFLNALKYGAPPHGGIGLGIDRLILSFLNKKDIKEFIPFPKNYNNLDLMLNTPTYINKKKLLELNIKTTKNDK